MDYKLKSERAEFTKFSEHFDQSLAPTLLGLEGERKRRFKIGVIFAIILVTISLYFSWRLIDVAPNMRKGGHAVFLAIVLPFILPMCGYRLVMAKLRKKTKHHLTGSISDFLGWQHSKPKKINKDERSKALAKTLYDFGALPKHHIVQTDDVLHGLHEHWPFGLREITLLRQSYTRYGPNMVFRGLILSFGVKRKIDGEAIITRSLNAAHPRKRPRIKHEGIIESPDGKITIRASNERIIRILMCKRFQRAIIEFDAKMPHTDLSCVLFNNELHIPISNKNMPMTNKNMFEVDLLADSMDSKIRVQKMLDEFSYVLELLDVFLKPRKCDDTGVTQVPEFRYLRQ